MSMINNGFDPFKVAQELTSKKSLKDLGTSMLMAGLTYGITEGMSLGQVTSGMKPMARFRAMAERGLINTGVRSSFTGEKLEHVFKSEFGSTMLAMGQSVLGDIGEKLSKRNEPVLSTSPGVIPAKAGILGGTTSLFQEGGLGKALLHGTLGGMYSQVTTGKFGTGFLGGSLGELFAPITESPQVTKLISSSVMFGLGGDVRDIETVGSVSESVVENNFLDHSRALDNRVLRQLEEDGIIPDGKAEELIHYNDEGRVKGLELSTDVLSLVASGGNPEGVVAKRTVVESIKSGTKKLGQFLSKKLNKVEKLS